MKLYCAWLKVVLRKIGLPRQKPQLHCRDCGWALPWNTASLICGPCAGLRASKIKLFCCDMDLTLVASWTRIRPGWQRTTTDRYNCPACDRIWLYITDWHKDNGSDAYWCPQYLEAEVYGQLPNIYNGRTRTKVYP